MGTIRIHLDDETETKFRQIVKREVGEGEIAIRKAIEEALRQWLDKKNQDEIAERLRKRMAKGFSMGGYKFNREELYDRY